MEQSSFFNAELTDGKYDREYNATDWAAYFATFVGNGVSCTPDTNLQVESSSGMSVIVNPGVAFINGYRYENTTPLTVEINQANSTYDRITSIILELNLNNRNITCKTIDGTAEPNPQSATLTRTNSVYQLQLGTVYISAGATNCGAITDTRENKEVCGFLELLAPTIPPQFIKDVILQGTIKNDGIISGGTLSSNLINGATINQPTINGGGWNNGVLNTPHIENGACLNTSIVLETKNGAKLDYFCDGKSFRLTNPATWQDLITIPESMARIEFNVPIQTNNGNYNNPTLTGKVNLNNGLYNNGTPVVTQQINIKSSVYITDTIQAYYTINYWVLDGGLLGSQNNSLNAKLGLMTISLYLDQTYTWNSGDPITLDIEGIPNVSAMTMTYNKAFNIGTGTNAVVINGIDSNGVTLNAYQTYTSQALLWGI